MSSILMNRAPATPCGRRSSPSGLVIRRVGKARNIGREARKAGRDAKPLRLPEIQVTAPVFLRGKILRLLPDENGELRAADGDRPGDPGADELSGVLGSRTPISPSRSAPA